MKPVTETRQKCSLLRKIRYGITAGLSFLYIFPVNVYAAPAPATPTTWSNLSLGSVASDANDGLAKIIGVLLGCMQAIGLIIVVYGVYDVISSFIQNSGEVKAKSIATVVIGVIMVSMREVLHQMNLIV